MGDVSARTVLFLRAISSSVHTGETGIENQRGWSGQPRRGAWPTLRCHPNHEHGQLAESVWGRHTESATYGELL